MQLSILTKLTTGDGRREIRELFDRMERKHLVATVLAILGTIYIFAPMYSGLTTAFKTNEGFVATLPLEPPPPEHFTITPWIEAGEVLAWAIWNSLVMTIPAMFFSAVLGSLAAYGLTMVDWRGQIGLMLLFVVAVFQPKQGVLVPLSQFWTWVDLDGILESLGLYALGLDPKYATILVLIITHTAYGIPICTLLFRGYYLTIDHDLIEAARIDGASIYGIYREIVAPLSYPMFMVVFIFQFTMIYNEFLYALILVRGSSPDRGAPVTLTLNELASTLDVVFNIIMAGAFIAAIPTIIVYILFGEQFAKGVEY